MNLSMSHVLKLQKVMGSGHLSGTFSAMLSFYKDSFITLNQDLLKIVKVKVLKISDENF